MTGYSEAVKETARPTDKRKILGESILSDLELKLHILLNMAQEQHDIEVSITYFKPDEKKEGGAYINTCGKFKKLEEHEQVIVLINGEKIPLLDILDISCTLFND